MQRNRSRESSSGCPEDQISISICSRCREKREGACVKRGARSVNVENRDCIEQR